MLLSHSFSIYQEIGWHLLGGQSFPSLAQFYQWADVIRFTMTFGLVGTQTPFNPKKPWWVDLWSM